MTPAEVARSKVELFADHLVDASVNLELHASNNTHLQDNLRALVSALGEAAKAGVPMPLVLDVHSSDLRYNGQVLTGPSLHAGRLLRRCAAMRIASLTFQVGVTVDEFLRLFHLFQMEEIAPSSSMEPLTRLMHRQGIRHVGLVPIPAQESNEPEESTDPDDHKAMHNYQNLVGYLQDSHVLAYHGRALELDKAGDMVVQTIASMEDESANLFSLAGQDNMDRFTVGHSVRVGLLALRVARASGADMDQLVIVGTAALLHDIGKSKVPQEILFKQGHLTEEEWAWMAQHPRLGAEILMEEQKLDPTAIGAAFCHHMAPEGGGYPQPAVVFDPSGVSKLVRVCDVFEALTSVRPYKQALTPVEAYAVMYRQVQNFDERWLQFFVRTIGLYPEGTRLLLDDGSEALVTGPGERLDQPQVLLETGPSGEVLPDDAPDRFAIGESIDGRTPVIESIITPRSIVRLEDIEPARVYTEGGPDISCGHQKADPEDEC